MGSTTPSRSKSAARPSKSRAGSSQKSISPSKSSTSVKPKSVAITNYTTALRWLYTHTDYERMRMVRYNDRTFSLDRVKRLLEYLGDPHEELQFVHVAGTKGKGSTVAMLGSMLQECGYTIGTFTSPHLTDLRERISIDGKMISHGEMTDLLKLVKTRAKKLGDDQPTFFEIMTVAAIRHFADQAVDLAILETGLGGRLDSTNVVTPLVAGITQISLDHMNVLGKDVTKIAGEKAGIMKEGVPTVTCAQEPAVLKVLQKHADETGGDLNVVGRDIEFSYRFEATRELGPHTRVCLATHSNNYEHLAVPLKGEHQAHNCGIALGIIDRLSEMGFEVPESKIIEGLAKTELAGRMELAWDQPRILLDGAHNGASIKALIKSIGAHVPYDSLVVVFATSEDKDVEGMLEQIALGADKVIFTRAKSNPRAVEAEQLLSRFGEISGKMAQSAGSLGEALNLAARAVGREDLICVTGSFYLVGEGKKYLADLGAKRAKQEAE